MALAERFVNGDGILANRREVLLTDSYPSQIGWVPPILNASITESTR